MYSCTAEGLRTGDAGSGDGAIMLAYRRGPVITGPSEGRCGDKAEVRMTRGREPRDAGGLWKPVKAQETGSPQGLWEEHGTAHHFRLLPFGTYDTKFALL